MATLRDFLNWFEGISENIERAPTDKQWAKIKERLLALKPDADAQPEWKPGQFLPAVAGPVINPEVDSDPRGTVVVAKWKAQVKALLLDIYDEKDAAKEMANIDVDLNKTPEEIVQRFLITSSQ